MNSSHTLGGVVQLRDLEDAATFSKSGTAKLIRLLQGSFAAGDEVTGKCRCIVTLEVGGNG